MKNRLVTVIAVLSSLTVMPSLAAAQQNDLAAGTGQQVGIPGLTDTFGHVNAISGPLGEDPRGTFRFVSTIGDLVFADLAGRVTCLTVVANRATVGGEVTESTTAPFPVGSGLTIQVDDNEQAGTPDGVNVFGTISPGFCPPPVFTQPINSGNFVVHDATP